ncbi:MAG: hypothetical protein ABJB16_13245 [Saprospiraceae bacterium]
MKNLLTILITFFFMMNVTLATVRTVSNDPTGGAQYSTLSAAYTAAVNGDTLLLEGTNITYSITSASNVQILWNKSLTVIGIGINPQKQNPRRTIINSYNSGAGPLTLQSTGNGSKFYGIEFTSGSSDITCASGASNYTFEDCRFNSGFTFSSISVSNFAFRNCVFDENNVVNLTLATNTTQIVSNILISNCVFDGSIAGGSNPYINVVIDHCLFLSTTTTIFSNLQFAIITNNMFMNIFPGGTTNSTYVNNLCRVAGTFPPVGGGGNSGSGNIEATNPNLVTYTVGQLWATTWDFHLQAGSAAIGTASDATDIGVHGGNSNFSEQGEVLINPIMRTVNITNPTVSPNGTLNVLVNATKPDDN